MACSFYEILEEHVVCAFLELTENLQRLVDLKTAIKCDIGSVNCRVGGFGHPRCPTGVIHQVLVERFCCHDRDLLLSRCRHATIDRRGTIDCEAMILTCQTSTGSGPEASQESLASVVSFCQTVRLLFGTVE